MPLTHSLLNSLQANYPTVRFTPDAEFRWSPAKQTVFYAENEPAADALLLHELGHAVSDHRAYGRDVELVTMEAEAWEAARQIAEKEKITLDEAIIEDHLDTYRDWLHARSVCPHCQSNGHQISADTYQCPACLQHWRVNEARHCQLRRYQTNTKTPL